MSDTKQECTATADVILVTRKTGKQWLIPVSRIDAIERLEGTKDKDIDRKDGSKFRRYNPVLRIHFPRDYAGDSHAAGDGSRLYVDVTNRDDDTIEALSLSLPKTLKAMYAHWELDHPLPEDR